MRATVPALGIALLFPLAALAGCIGGHAPSASKENHTAVTNSSNTSNFTLPDGRGTSAAGNDTNLTINGTFGQAHTHDYWKGHESIVVYQNDVFVQTAPVFPEGQGSNPEGFAFLKLTQPALVYEGTNEVDIVVKDPKVNPIGTAGATAPDPSPPGVKLLYRTASSAKLVAGPAITLGSTAVLKVTPEQTDMPHSVSSLWAFELITDKPTGDSFNVTITIKRGAEILSWPGHPDFYADKDSRVIVDKDYKVHRSGIDEGLLYGAGSTWNNPDRLVSWGTGTLDVFVNITSATASNGAPPTGFFLEYHNATILDEEDQFNERLDDVQKHNDLKSYHFLVKVDPNGMDGPYQPSSLWGFRPVATFGNIDLPTGGGVGLCPGCFPYDISYHLTIVAHKAADGTAGMTM